MNVGQPLEASNGTKLSRGEHVTPVTHVVTDALAESTVTMYFSVFPCNCAPIFCSNRIPSLRSAPPHCDGSVLYIGPAREVAQQKLQELAFPRGFGCKTTEVRSGPLYSARLEQVRKRGVLRYHRIEVASTFVALVVSENGELRTMRAKHTAVAVVITCPPNTSHYDTLLQNFNNVVRYALHVSLDFAMWATQRFFLKLSRTTVARDLVAELEQHDRALETYNFIGAILANALTYRSTVPRLRSNVHLVTPQSDSESAVSDPLADMVLEKCKDWSFSGSANMHVHRALCKLRGFSERFASRVVAGLLSASNWEGYGVSYRGGKEGCVGNAVGEALQQQARQQESHGGASASGATEYAVDGTDIYADYWRFMEEQEKLHEMARCGVSCGVGSGARFAEKGVDKDESDVWMLDRRGDSPPLRAPSDGCGLPTDSMDLSRTGASVASCPLSPRRVGRVVIFTTNPDMAACLMVLAAFFVRDRHVSTSDAVPDVAPFAGLVESCVHPSLPVQWLMEEYNPRRFERFFCSPYTVENVVLVIAPHSFVCQRLRVHKTFSVNPILVERFRERHPVVRPFQRQLLSNVTIAADDTITAALRTACQLQKPGDPSPNCTKFLEWFVVLLLGRCHAIRSKHRLKGQRIGGEQPCSLPIMDSTVRRANNEEGNNPVQRVYGFSFMELVESRAGNTVERNAEDHSNRSSACKIMDFTFSGPDEGSQLLQYLPYD